MGSILSNDAPFSNDSPLRLFVRLIEDVPESQRLVACASHDDSAVRTHAQIQDTVCVAGQADYLRHTRVLPDVDSMLRVAVCTDKFRSSLRKEQVADLTARVMGADEVRVWHLRRIL